MKYSRLALYSIVVLSLALLLAGGALARPATIAVVTVKGMINPVVSDYIQGSISRAASDGVEMVVIVMDTPGGFDSSMREIVQAINNSSVPVAVYVAPSGSRAASAGAFITMSAQVAAMAPGTTIGAAHPVSLGLGGVTNVPSDEETKIVNDAVAYIRGLALTRSRNADWAEKAVRESVAVTAEEAVKLKVVDLVAPDISSLLDEVNGRRLAWTTATGAREVTLNTAGAQIVYTDMSFGQRFLFTISDPNIAFLLLALAGLGIFFEFTNPGSIFPGVIGGIALLLALQALAILPVNYAGLALMGLAFILFAAELFVTSQGLLTVGGIVSLTIGSLILFGGGSSMYEVNRWLIAAVVAAVAAFFIFVVGMVYRSQRKRSTVGSEGLPTSTAIVKETLDPSGFVLVEGELWAARSKEGKINPGEEVIVTKVDGLKLEVARKKSETGGN